MRGMRKPLLICPLLFAAACGDNLKVNETPDAGGPDASIGFVEAPHGSAPQLVDLGGPVLTAPKIVPIFFANDATVQAQIEDFLTQLAASPYWTTTTSEYGVGPITVMPTIVSADAPPTTDTGLETWLAGNFDGMHAGFPATPDQGTIYSVFLPAGITLHTEFGDSCQSFGGYHDEAMGLQGQSIVYALLPRCGAGADGVDSLTVATSHEWIEASTDPFVETALAYGDADPDHYVMSLTPGAEAGDYCEYLPSAAARLVGTYAVQRTWSNAASRAGSDPCVPAPTTPYLGAAAMFTQQMSIDGENGPVMTKGVEVALHGTAEVDVALFSDSAADAFTVKAVDVAAAFNGTPAELTFAWDKTTGVNGDTLHLTVTRAAAGQLPGSEFLIETKNSSNKTVGMWWGFASN